MMHEINKHRIKIIINCVKKAIYNVLFDHFDAPPKAALLASLLDPRFKKMRGWLNEIQLSTISLLREEYLLIKDEETTAVTQIMQMQGLLVDLNRAYLDLMK